MRSPSERTILTLNSLNLRRFFSKLTTQGYYFVRAGRSGAVRIGHHHEFVERLALIERDDLVHAAHAELLPIRLSEVMRWHLRIGPAEHRHHLALSAVGVSGNLGASLTYAVTAFLGLVDAGQDRVFLEFRRPRLFRCVRSRRDAALS